MIAERQDGPLPALLVVLTLVSGLVDAFSYLRLGHVFVSNMTGNVVFLGFALAGVGDISVRDSLLALVAFAAGAALGGWAAKDSQPHRGHLLAAAAAIEAGLVLVVAVLATVSGMLGGVRLVLVVLLAVAMGAQNSVVRRLGVPDLSTTVLTRALTGLFSDPAGPAQVRRMISVLGVLAGALLGGVLLRWVSTPAPLWVSGALLAGCAIASQALTRRPGTESWR